MGDESGEGGTYDAHLLKTGYPQGFVTAKEMRAKDDLLELNDEQIDELIESTRFMLKCSRWGEIWALLKHGIRRQFGSTGDCFVVADKDGAVEVYKLIAEYDP